MKIHPELLKQLKEYYTPGTRVELVRMIDPYTRLKPGDKGTVIMVDAVGTIHCIFDCGSTLGVAYSEDECRKVEE